MIDNPYRTPKKLPGKSRREDFVSDGRVFLNVMMLGVMFIVGCIVGVFVR